MHEVRCTVGHLTPIQNQSTSIGYLLHKPALIDQKKTYKYGPPLVYVLCVLALTSLRKIYTHGLPLEGVTSCVC